MRVFSTVVGYCSSYHGNDSNGGDGYSSKDMMVMIITGNYQGYGQKVVRGSKSPRLNMQRSWVQSKSREWV